MAKSHRSELSSRDKQRFRIKATVERFGSRPGWTWTGDEPTVLLRDVTDAETGKLLTDHLWFNAGKWSASLSIGDAVSFDARVGSYTKGYMGRRAGVHAPISTDWRLERPTKVVNHGQDRCFAAQHPPALPTPRPMADPVAKTYRIESSYKLRSEWFPASEFTRIYVDRSNAVATAIEGVADPAEQEVRVVCVEDGEVVWRSTDYEYGCEDRWYE